MKIIVDDRPEKNFYRIDSLKEGTRVISKDAPNKEYIIIGNHMHSVTRGTLQRHLAFGCDSLSPGPRVLCVCTKTQSLVSIKAGHLVEVIERVNRITLEF